MNTDPETYQRRLFQPKTLTIPETLIDLRKAIDDFIHINNDLAEEELAKQIDIKFGFGNVEAAKTWITQ